MIDIKDYEDRYAVTKYGGVYSKKRKIFLKFGSQTGGYRSVCLAGNGKPKSISVHRLVAMAYVDNPDNKEQVNHIDGNKLNNAAENLEWVTTRENTIHAIETGLANPSANKKSLFKKGFDSKRCDNSKLSEEQVIKIRWLSHHGSTYRDISKVYPIDESSIRRCCKRESYKHIM